MSDWHPQVVKIESIRNHPDADALDIATVLGDYPVIIKRGEYQVGDLAGYIPIDSIVPDIQHYYFLCPKAYEKYEDENGQMLQRQMGPKYPVGSVPEKYRIIKAKRIRGTYSQGMLVELGPIAVTNAGRLVILLLMLCNLLSGKSQKRRTFLVSRARVAPMRRKPHKAGACHTTTLMVSVSI